MTIKITVVTVAYQAIEALAHTMQSVESQDYADLEYIVVDGASNDGTDAMLRTYHSRHSFRWVSEADRGIYDAMNKGVAMATGHYCIFMNAGDTFASPTVVSQVVDAIGTNSADGALPDVVYGDIVKNTAVKRSLSPRNCHKMYYCHQAVFTLTTCLRDFPFDIAHRFSADFKQSKQLYLAGKRFVQLPLVVANFDLSGISNTQRSRGLMDNIRVVREVDSFADQCRLLPRLCFTWLMCRIRGK